ncbi:PaaX family transcriptional regulator [Nocardia pseudovaccinii]|uniref:PaaX family transcriptional regulator n=1 Tax=Nocardia pseudovaccinii TaxID=189540 RepID=UPI003D90531D
MTLGFDFSDVLRTRAARPILVAFLATVVRRMGNWVPASAAVELMSQLGLEESSVRTAVFRLRKTSWLRAETRDRVRGYALTDIALEALSEVDVVITTMRQPAVLQDGWCLVHTSIPERQRSVRHQLRSRLSSVGFGNLGSGLWVAPARMEQVARSTLTELRLHEQSVIFVGAHIPGHDLERVVGRCWDLPAINERYRSFVHLHRPPAEVLRSREMIDGRAAFAAYMTLIDDWRGLPLRDPGLPRELLGTEWAAEEAVAVFDDFVATLEGRALAYAAGYWPNVAV